MSAEDYAVTVKARNPELFAAKRVAIKPEELLRIMERAFNAGQEAGRDEKSLFGQIFGKLAKERR